MSTTVVIAGVSIPLYGVVAVVLCAASIYAFSTTSELKQEVEILDKCRKDLIQLETDNP